MTNQTFQIPADQRGPSHVIYANGNINQLQNIRNWFPFLSGFSTPTISQSIAWPGLQTFASLVFYETKEGHFCIISLSFMFLSTFKISTLHVMIVVYARRSKQHIGDSRRITVQTAAGGTVDFSEDLIKWNSEDQASQQGVLDVISVEPM